MNRNAKKPKRRSLRVREKHGIVCEPATFRIERILPGPIERVWAYLTEPEKRRKWFGAGLMELKVGGRVQLQFRFSELTKEKPPANTEDACEVPGMITRCEPPRLLSYTWGTTPDASEVTFELTRQGKDVLLVVTHRRLGDAGKMVSVASGWHTHLDLLADRLGGRGLRPFWATKNQKDEEYRERFFGT